MNFIVLFSTLCAWIVFLFNPKVSDGFFILLGVLTTLSIACLKDIYNQRPSKWRK